MTDDRLGEPETDREGSTERVADLAISLGHRRALLAGMLSRMKRDGSWRVSGHFHFRGYVENECRLSYRLALTWIRVHDLLEAQGVSLEQLADLPWEKVTLASRVITAKNREDLLDDLKVLTIRALRSKYDPSCLEVATPEPAPSIGTPEPTISGLARMGWRVAKPHEEEFYVTEEVWEQCAYGVEHGRSVLVVGESGCGKTEVCYRIAQAMGRPLVAMNCGAMSEPRSALIGVTHLDGRRGTRFMPSRFARAFQCRMTCLLLDELSRAGPEAFNILVPALDAQGYLALDESEDASVVRRASGVAFLATANVGLEYTGTERLDRAILDRFPILIEMAFPPPVHERRVLLHRCVGLSEHDAERLVAIADRQRTLAHEGEFVGSVSTRALIAAGEQVGRGVAFDIAFKYCVLSRFSTEGGEASEQVKLLQIAQGIGETRADGWEKMLEEHFGSSKRPARPGTPPFFLK